MVQRLSNYLVLTCRPPMLNSMGNYRRSSADSRSLLLRHVPGPSMNSMPRRRFDVQLFQGAASLTARSAHHLQTLLPWVSSESYPYTSTHGFFALACKLNKPLCFTLNHCALLSWLGMLHILHTSFKAYLWAHHHIHHGFICYIRVPSQHISGHTIISTMDLYAISGYHHSDIIYIYIHIGVQQDPRGLWWRESELERERESELERKRHSKKSKRERERASDFVAMLVDAFHTWALLSMIMCAGMF